jgi:hypothetical protein
MKSLHSRDASPHIINGLIADHNFARPSEVLEGRTPAELVYGWSTLDGKDGWFALLRLAESYKHVIFKEAKHKVLNLAENASRTLDLFLGQSLTCSRVEPA